MPQGLTPEKEIARLKYLITQKVNWANKLEKMILLKCECEAKDLLVEHLKIQDKRYEPRPADSEESQ